MCKIDGRSFFEVFGWVGYFSNMKFGVDDLGKYFIVKDKVIGVGVEVD